MDWRSEVTETLVDLIRAANGGSIPRALEDWRKVCAYYHLDLFISDAPSRARGILMDDVLVVQRGRTGAETCCRIAHEIAEYLLQSTYAAPYHFPPSNRTAAQERHLVASIVEHRMPGCGKPFQERVNPAPRMRQDPAGVDPRASQRLESRLDGLAAKLEAVLSLLSNGGQARAASIMPNMRAAGSRPGRILRPVRLPSRSSRRGQRPIDK